MTEISWGHNVISCESSSMLDNSDKTVHIGRELS